MKKLVIIGANDFQNQLILKAKSLGYETHVFAWEDGAVGKYTADYFYPVSIIEKDEILEKCREIEPDGVCSIGSDLASVTVNYVAEKLGLTCNPTCFTAMQTNKAEMRKAFLNGGVSCPRFVKTGESFDKNLISDFRFPVIVKPTDRSGSRGIMKLETLDGIEEAVREACGYSFEKSAVVEEFIEGDEYSMETVSFGGVHHHLATTKKFTTGAPHFIETGHREPSGLSKELEEKAIREVFKALDALNVRNSADHSEFKVDKDGNIGIIEIGARMGGDCIGSDLVYLSTGNDFMKMVIDIACGNEPEIKETPDNNSAEIHFLFTEEDIEEMNKFPKDKLYRVSDIDYSNLGHITDSSTRLGYYIITDKR